jgi:phosphoribosylaminoimidazole carboxylase PurE protein
MQLFIRGEKMAEKMGLILVDTKYEFGKKDGEIYLIDEIHTPDSSRYFYADDYAVAFKEGKSPKQLSKEFVRDWLREHGFEGKTYQEMPVPTDEKVTEFSMLYKELYTAITGKKFEGPAYETQHETDFQHEQIIRGILYKAEQLCTPPVAIIMGSDSDMEIMKPAMDTLAKFEIPYSVHIISAHRTPEAVKDFVRTTGAKIFIAGAGLAAHLAGAIAVNTLRPVIGVPIQAANSIPGDSVVSTLQMPSGIPVATVGLNNAKNAALLAIQILGIDDYKISNLLDEDRKKMRNEVFNKNQNIKRMDFLFCMKNESNESFNYYI